MEENPPPTNPSELRGAIKDFLGHYGIEFDARPENEEADPSEDAAELIHKTQEKIDEFSQQAVEIEEKLGMSREELQDYINNPKNFTAEQWAALQKVKEEAENMRQRIHGALGGEGVVKEATQKRKRKKQRHKFGKKKDWIPL